MENKVIDGNINKAVKLMKRKLQQDGLYRELWHRKGGNAELTDFASRAGWRGGQGLTNSLLYRLETEMRTAGISTAYTIARTYSFGMNITFAKHGYTYGGTLTNNTQISGDLESMFVWYKHL